MHTATHNYCFVQLGRICEISFSKSFKVYVCVSYLSHSWDKISDKSNLRIPGFVLAHGLRIQSLMLEKAWWWELEAADYITFALSLLCCLVIINAYICI